MRGPQICAYCVSYRVDSVVRRSGRKRLSLHHLSNLNGAHASRNMNHGCPRTFLIHSSTFPDAT